MNQMKYNEYVGIVLIDEMYQREEIIMKNIGDHTNVLFIGGSAGDGYKFEETFVFANGKAYPDAAVFMLMKPEIAFDTLKVRGFEPSGKILKITKADSQKRKIYELKDKPAVRAYAEALDIYEDQLEDHFVAHPLGLMYFSNQPYVRSPKKIEGDGIVMFSKIMPGMEMMLLNATNIVDDTHSVIARKNAEMNGISAIIDFHGTDRSRELKRDNMLNDYGHIYKDIPTIVFSTYGEWLYRSY